jgi:uncharacterized protein
MDNYDFSWNSIGNVKIGRPNLGMTTRVEVYRLMQYTMRAVLEKEYGDETTRKLLFNAGKLAGIEFCKNILDTTLTINKFIAQLDQKLQEFYIGILRIEKFNSDTLNLTLTISEDLDCSGLPISGNTVCDYDEGFLNGVFMTYTGREFIVKEIDCWSTGERTCRFTVCPKQVSQNEHGK